MNKQHDCFYCIKNQQLHDLMIEVYSNDISTLYLNKDQTHKGRCIVALNEHKNELFELSDDELKQFMKSISNAARAIKEIFHADKINYAIYGDLVSHLHFHLVPKYKGKKEWGEAFINSPEFKVKEKEEIMKERVYKLRNYYEKMTNGSK
ncbi:HIT family protein [Gracilibacillus sp. YIM 98692]|uniref:HIT family protein n=1 Tax=Gracilibacillus sp. YIM 98692 TaxID=2663532 RepID=UPI0013D4CC8E|nr:HIT family protein [Gracilibacillus sp. YIM 98692]